MKNLVLVSVLALAMVGCSSKKVTTAKTETTKAVETATTTAKTTADKVVADTKKAVETATTATTTTTTTATDAVTYTCSLKKDERKIAVSNTTTTNCEVNYTKMGATSRIATAKNGTTYCTNVATKIKTNLEKSGYTCKM
jgi:hypothetical protein